MQKKFASNITFALVLNFLIKPFYLFKIEAEIQNRVGNEAYGIYFSLLGISFILNFLLDIGIINYNVRNIAQYPHFIQKYFSKLLGVKIILGLIYLIFSVCVISVIGIESKYFLLFVVLLFNQVLVSLILFIRSNIQGLLMLWKDSIISVIDRLLGIIFFSSIFYFTSIEINIFWLAYFQFFSYLIVIIACLYVLKNKIKPLQFSINLKFALATIKKSYPFAILGFIMMIYYKIDGVMLERLLPNGASEAGIYAQAYRFFDAGNNVSYLFASLLLPLFAKIIKDNKKVAPLVETGFRTMFTGAFIVCIISFFYAEEIMNWLYISNQKETANAFKYLIICFLAISINYVFGTLLTAGNNLKQLNLIALAGMLINVALNLILIPMKGAEGAALASMVTQVLVMVLQIVLSILIFKLKISLKIWLQLVLFIALSFSLIYLIKTIALSYIIKIFISLFSGFIIAIIVKLFDIKTFLSVLKTRN